VRRRRTDVPILGSGGAALFAALHAKRAALANDIAMVERPFHTSDGDLDELRERLHDIARQDVGMVRNRQGLIRSLDDLAEIDDTLDRRDLATAERAFNLTWQDWLNLKSLILVTRAIATAALAREESRGTHFRNDFPATRLPDQAEFITVTMEGHEFRVTRTPAAFARVRPGESLIRSDAA
jgi:fumarate reductase flavoprotein subunit